MYWGWGVSTGQFAGDVVWKSKVQGRGDCKRYELLTIETTVCIEEENEEEGERGVKAGRMGKRQGDEGGGLSEWRYINSLSGL